MTRTTFGPFVFDPSRGELVRDGQPVPANHRGIRLLATLLRTPGHPVEKRTLMDAAWPDTAVEESNLSVQIAALRKLLGAATDGREWIATVPRVGYRFAGAISNTAENDDSENPASEEPLIAVLPFENISDEPGNGYLADGVTDDIITALARYRWFRVVARGSAFALRDEAIDVDERARLLGARYVLRGSIRRSAQRIRISSQLIDARDGAHLWAGRYDLTLSDLFAIQDEIAERVVGAIEPELLQSEARLAVTRHTGNVTAWNLVRQGMWHFHKITHEGHCAARELFRQACAIDPNLAEAHSWLGRVSAGIIAYGWSNDAVADGREGTNAAMRAIALDPRDLYSYYSFAIVSCYAGSASTATLAAQNAIDINPSFALGHLVLGMARLFDGQAERAIAPLKHGLMLNPNDPQNVAWHVILAFAYLFAGQPHEGIDCANKALILQPLFGPTFVTLVCCSVALGQLGEARDWAKRMTAANASNSEFISPLRANPDYARCLSQWLYEAGA